MKYSTPTILAQNEPHGNYAAGCPLKGTGMGFCRTCERTQ